VAVATAFPRGFGSLALSLSNRVSSSSAAPQIRDHLVDRTRAINSNVYNSIARFQPYGKFHDHQHPYDRPRWAPHHHPATTNNHCLLQNRTISAHHLCVEFFIYSLHTIFPYRLGYLRKRQHIPCRPNGWKDSRHRYQCCMGCIWLAAEQRK
jgi:hypothetical protein